MNKQILKTAIKTLLIKANTVLDESVYDCLTKIKDKDKRDFILKNCKIAYDTGRPLCQDTGQVLVFLKLPYDFNFGFDFKKTINEAVEETYEEESYRKSVVKNALFDRKNTKTNTPAIIYTDFEDRKSVKIDVLIKGGGAENTSFVKMFNPTATENEIINKISDEIKNRGINACPPLFIGIGAGGTMDYAALLSKKALFEGIENNFCKKLKEKCNNIEVLSIKILSNSTHIASLPVAVTINCHSNRHSDCEIGNNGIICNKKNYELIDKEIDFSEFKKINYETDEQFCKNLQVGDKILFSGTIYTMRDAAHQRIAQMLDNGEKLPFEIKNSIIFYAGPAPKKGDEIIGPIGPTTSKRMDKFAPRLYDLGCSATIGKGERSQEVVDACKRNNAHYFTAQGGVACLLQQSFKTAELVAFKDLDTEAIYKFEVENLPLKVEI